MKKSSDKFYEKFSSKNFSAEESLLVYIKPVLILFLSMVIASTALLRANIYYFDDLNRMITGEAGWDHFSRYLSCFFARIIHANWKLTDVSPLTQLLALLIIAAAGIILIKVITGKSKISYLAIMAVIPLGFNPYFMECLSYKYDAPYMALSILGAVLPVLFIHRKHWVFSLASAVSALIICTTYQAAIGIYPMLILFLSYLNWNKGTSYKELFKTLGFAAGGYLLGLLFFRLILMKPIDSNDYITGAIFPISKLIPGSIGHYQNYIRLLRQDFPTHWMVLIGINCAGFLFSSVTESKQNKFLSLLFSSITLFCMFLLSFGAYPFMESDFDVPRSMYGLGGFLAIVSVYLVSRPKVILLKLSAVVLSWCFLVFGFTYGNALNVQKDYSDFLTAQIYSDLCEVGIQHCHGEIIMDITGCSGENPILEMAKQEYPILRRLIIPTLSSRNWVFGNEILRRQYLYPLSIQMGNLSEADLPLLKESLLYNIYGQDNSFKIELKEPLHSNKKL